jgi:hypothetical protein
MCSDEKLEKFYEFKFKELNCMGFLMMEIVNVYIIHEKRILSLMEKNRSLR